MIDLERFKKALELCGSSWEEYSTEVCRQEGSIKLQSLPELDKVSLAFYFDFFRWGDTSQGYGYWGVVSDNMGLSYAELEESKYQEGPPAAQDLFPDSQYGIGLSERQLSDFWGKYDD